MNGSTVQLIKKFPVWGKIPRKILFEMSTAAQAVKKLQFCVTRKIITVYTTARNRSLSKGT
jgi:hypothetical protein